MAISANNITQISLSVHDFATIRREKALGRIGAKCAEWAEYMVGSFAMLRFVEKFKSEESGAITVDWVVLTAAILGVMFGALTVFHTGAKAHADLTSETIAAQDIPDY